MDTDFSYPVNRDQLHLLATLAQSTGKLDNSPVGFVMFGLSPTYIILTHNNFYRHLFPAESVPTGFQGRSLAEFLPPGAADDVFAIFGEVERTGKVAQINEFPFDGLPYGRTWWNWVLLPVYTHNRQLISLSLFAVDVTESVLARQKLEETNRRLIAELAARAELEEQKRLQNRLLDAVEQAVIATDLQGTIFYWNRFAESLYGWPSEEAVGRKITEVIPAPEQLQWANQVLKNLRLGQSWAGEFLVQHRDGHRFPAYVTDSPIYNDSGELIGIVGVSSDISERQQADNEIRHLNESLEKRVTDRTRELSVLYDVASLATQSLDPDVMLQQVMSKVLTAMHSAAATVQLAEAEQPTFTLVGKAGLPASLIAILDEIPIDTGIPGRVLSGEQPVILHNLSQDVWGQEIVQATGLCTYIGAPMRRGGTTIGVLSVYSDGLHAYSAEDIALLSSIADLLAVILQNSQLWKLTQQQLRQLNLLYQADSTLHSHLKMEQVLQTLPELAVDIGGASCAWFLRNDRSGSNFVLWGQCSLNNVTPDSARYIPGEKLAGHAAAVGEAILVQDIESDERIAQPELLTLAGIRALGCIPLTVNGITEGTLVVAFDRRGGANLDAWRFCISLAERATLAIKNAQIYEKAQRVAILEERQRLARELHDSVNQALFGLTTYAEFGRQQSLRRSDQTAAEQWQVAKEMAQQAMKEMRLLVYELRSEAVQRQGVAAALQQRLNMVEKRTGIETKFTTHNLPAALSPEVEDALYFMAQEALNNTLKRARATQVAVELSASENEITLTIIDNGLGFELDGVRDTSDMGLFNLAGRATALGGNMRVKSTVGVGTMIESSIPIANHP
jgi:PAS domain S-box-containing protein